MGIGCSRGPNVDDVPVGRRMSKLTRSDGGLVEGEARRTQSRSCPRRRRSRDAIGRTRQDCRCSREDDERASASSRRRRSSARSSCGRDSRSRCGSRRPSDRRRAASKIRAGARWPRRSPIKGIDRAASGQSVQRPRDRRPVRRQGQGSRPVSRCSFDSILGGRRARTRLTRASRAPRSRPRRATPSVSRFPRRLAPSSARAIDGGKGAAIGAAAGGGAGAAVVLSSKGPEIVLGPAVSSRSRPAGRSTCGCRLSGRSASKRQTLDRAIRTKAATANRRRRTQRAGRQRAAARRLRPLGLAPTLACSTVSASALRSSCVRASSDPPAASARRAIRAARSGRRPDARRRRRDTGRRPASRSGPSPGPGARSTTGRATARRERCGRRSDPTGVSRSSGVMTSPCDDQRFEARRVRRERVHHRSVEPSRSVALHDRAAQMARGEVHVDRHHVLALRRERSSRSSSAPRFPARAPWTSRRTSPRRRRARDSRASAR